MIIVKYKDLKQVPVNVTNVFKALNYISQTINWHLVLLIKWLFVLFRFVEEEKEKYY